MDWLIPTPKESLTPLYAATLLPLLLYWFVRIGLEARKRRVMRANWWFLAGWSLLWLSPVLATPVLFGIGAAVMLIAEYVPNAFRPKFSRPDWHWALVGVLIGLGLLWQNRFAQAEDIAPFIGMMVFVAGFAALLMAAFYPQPARSTPTPSLDLRGRFGPVQTPEPPEWSIELTPNGVALTNNSAAPLWLAGWSPAFENAWLPAQSSTGRALERVAPGEMAFLPLPAHAGGLRLRYAPSPTDPLRLFRANWHARAAHEPRVLN